MSEIMTRSHKMFDPLHPDAELIDIKDLAHEFINLMDASIVDPTPVIFSQPEYAFTGFDRCRQEFLELFHQLNSK